jgi:hypothetical protein
VQLNFAELPEAREGFSVARKRIPAAGSFYATFWPELRHGWQRFKIDFMHE